MALAVTLDILRKMFPATPTETLSMFVAPLNTVIGVYNINTKQRLAMFLAQVGHESGELRYFKENLNYSADALQRVFKKYFPTPQLAAAYARQPVKIANRVYANRMGNGNEASGDGWRFRGQGLIQLTGRANITAFAQGLGMSIDEVLAYLATPEGATLAAAWFWQSRKLNAVADTGNFTKVTQLINGGQNGAEHRLVLYKRALQLL